MYSTLTLEDSADSKNLGKASELFDLIKSLLDEVRCLSKALCFPKQAGGLAFLKTLLRKLYLRASGTSLGDVPKA